MSCVVNITELSVCCYLSLSFEKRKDRAVEVLAVVPEMLSQQHQLIAIAACAVQLQEPLLLVAAFALLFALTIAYNRCDLTITRDAKWQASQGKELAAHLVERIAAVIARE